MKLLSDIINELIDESISLQRPLLKMKVLASRVGNSELLEWVNNELQGYIGIDKEVPNYRKTMSNVMGSYINGNRQFNNVSVPIFGLSDKMEEFMMIFEVPSGIQTIESGITSNKSGMIEMSLPSELQKQIETNIRKNGNPYFQLLEVRKEISAAFLTQIVSNVRSKLLDLALQLEQTFGLEVDIIALSKKDDSVNKTINTIMSQTVINTTGHGNIINTGNENEIVNNSVVNTADFESLRKFLTDNKVSDEDINELHAVIDNDNPVIEEKKMGTKVGDWTKKMLGKAIDGSWKVSLAIAGKLLADAIQIYYGWK
jgi:hypothetical protein